MRTLQSLTASVIGCLLGIGHADLGAQSNVYTVPLTYTVPDEGPRPNFAPTGTKVPLVELQSGQTLPPGAVHPARQGLIQVGPTRESWIPMLVAATADEPGVFTRLYIDMNRDGDFSDDGPPAVAILHLNEETGNGRILFEEIELRVRFPKPERTEPFVVSFWYIHRPADPEPDTFIRYSGGSWRSGSVTVDGVPALVAAMDKHNDALYGPGDQWGVAEASMPEASKHVLNFHFGTGKGEMHSTERLMFLQRGADAADLVLEFRSFAADGSSVTFAVVDHPISKADDRRGDDLAAAERTRPRATTAYTWTEDLDSAMAAAKAAGKPIFLYFESDWCGPCQIMDEWVWTDAEVATALERGYVGVKLDGDIEKAHVERYDVTGYPTMLIVDPTSGTTIKSVEGYQSSQELLDFLHAQAPPRAVRRDLPLTYPIERAHLAGTRDSTGAPGPAYWQLWLDYDIRTRLDPRAGTVSGQERIVVHNRSPEALEQIVLRLDQNVYRANVPRSRTVPEITGGITISRLSVNGQPVAFLDWPLGSWPDDAPLTAPVMSDPTQTVTAIRLPEAIPAGARAVLEAEWSFRVPKMEFWRAMRMGAWGDSLYQVAQWYPQVAVYDDLRGWNTDPYLGKSEFFNAFGSFDLRIDVPAGWIVGATGELQNPEEVLTATARERLATVLDSDATVAIVTTAERDAGRATAPGERLVWHFRADTVNDVAWATSDRYIWNATRATIPGVGPIPVHLLHTPASAELDERVAGLTRHALEFYSGLWMPYAFPQLTVAEGPEMGMEYPMFLMSGAGAADHEVGHQWWPMMVGTNETRYDFMDEGFTVYGNILSRAHSQGRDPDLDDSGQFYGVVSGRGEFAPLMSNANFSGRGWAYNAYSKAEAMLSMLGGMVGDTVVSEAMSEYARAWRFKHPSPWDYAFFMNRALGQDLDWFWYYWLFTTERVDGSIQDVRAAGETTLVEVHQAGQMPSPVVLRVEFAPAGPAVRPMVNSVLLEDGAALVTYPVDVWFDGARTFTAELDFGGRAVQRVILDPHGRFPDRDPSDNAWPREQ